MRSFVSLGLLVCLGVFLSACSETSAEEPAVPSAAEGTALARCAGVDFDIPAPARPSSGAPEGEASFVPQGKGTVRFHGRASGKASWVASVPKNLAYAYFAEDGGGRVSFDVQVGEEPGGKSRDVTVRLDHVWRPGEGGALCSAPTASVSIHENIDDEQAQALAGTVVVKTFDPDGRHLGVSFEAETTAYKIFVDLDFTGKPRLAGHGTAIPMTEQTNVEKRAERGPVLGLIAGLGLSAAGGVGVTACVWRLIQAFDTVQGPTVAPEHKAKMLADGIGGAMTVLAAGVGVAVVGLVLASVSAYQLRRRRSAEA